MSDLKTHTQTDTQANTQANTQTNTQADARANADADAPAASPSAAGTIAFAFGDPEPVLDARGLMDYLDVALVGDVYEPPVSPDGIARSFGANVHHASAIQVKRNILLSCFRPSALLSDADFERAAQDYLVFGNAYFEKVTNRLGVVTALKPVLAKYMRRLKHPGRYAMVEPSGKRHDFAPGSVIHLMEADLSQEIYGVPPYLAALQSAFLNEAATLFRRKYYLNGSHAGFILYLSDAAQDQADIDALRAALKDAKGPGNFRNLFMYAPGGQKDGLKVIPLAEVAARDEFLNIKNVTRDDVLAAHRVPPALMGIIPANTGGFGSPETAAMVFDRNELAPLKRRFLRLNHHAGPGRPAVAFDPYRIGQDTDGGAAPDGG